MSAFWLETMTITFVFGRIFALRLVLLANFPHISVENNSSNDPRKMIAKQNALKFRTVRRRQEWAPIRKFLIVNKNALLRLLKKHLKKRNELLRLPTWWASPSASITECCSQYWICFPVRSILFGFPIVCVRAKCSRSDVGGKVCFRILALKFLTAWGSVTCD